MKFGRKPNRGKETKLGCRWRTFLSKSEQILAMIVEARVKKILGEFALFQV